MQIGHVTILVSYKESNQPNRPLIQSVSLRSAAVTPFNLLTFLSFSDGIWAESLQLRQVNFSSSFRLGHTTTKVTKG